MFIDRDQNETAPLSGCDVPVQLSHAKINESCPVTELKPAHKHCTPKAVLDPS